MKSKILSVIALSSCLLGASLQAGVVENLINAVWKKEQAAPATIKILILHDKPGAVLEVKGKYKIFDPRNNIPRIGRIVVARGRDAADIPLIISFGPHVLKSFRVWTYEVFGLLATENASPDG